MLIALLSIELNQFHDREIYQRILFLYQRCHFYRQIRVFVVIWSCIITRKAIQQYIVIVMLIAVHILPQHRFTAHNIHQSGFYGSQRSVPLHKIKALRMMPDFQMFIRRNAANHIVHHIAQCLWQLIRLAKAQYLGQIALRVNIHYQNSLAFHGSPAPIQYTPVLFITFTISPPCISII